ncbi:MAG: ATP synthase F1 subunit gamma [Kiritimatiellia bacterium]
MATARDLNNKIASLTNMQKVMSAMNMIASTKLRKLIIRHPALVQFERMINNIRDDIASGLNSFNSPLLRSVRKVRKIHIVAYTADKGLCGSHNSSVLKTLARTVKTQSQKGVSMDITCIGGRARNFCRKREFNIRQEIDSSEQHISDEALREIATDIVQRIAENEVDKVILIYNHFVSTLVQKTQEVQVLPFVTDSKTGSETDTDIEPQPDDFILSSAKLYLYYKLKTALTDSYLSEHAARMTAMEQATANADDLVSRYIKIRNRARQAAITSELIEIVAGTEALNN